MKDEKLCDLRTQCAVMTSILEEHDEFIEAELNKIEKTIGVPPDTIIRSLLDNAVLMEEYDNLHVYSQ
jgi:hypothetical protein